MVRFSHQISFTSAAWHTLMENTHDPLQSIRTQIESLGGKLQHAFFTHDVYDVLAITEFPFDVSPADLTIAFYAGGAVANIHTSPLLTVSQAQEAKRNSGPSSSRRSPRVREFANSAT